MVENKYFIGYYGDHGEFHVVAKLPNHSAAGWYRTKINSEHKLVILHRSQLNGLVIKEDAE